MHRPLTRQRGVAVVTAMLLTTLAISIVASLFWQQQVQVRSMENQRLQSQTKWIQRGALDWASVILRVNNNSNYTSLDQVWATHWPKPGSTSTSSVSGSRVKTSMRRCRGRFWTPRRVTI